MGRMGRAVESVGGLKVIGRTVFTLAGVVYAFDVAHAYSVLRDKTREEEQQDLEWDENDDLRNPERHYLHEPGSESDLLVRKDTFEQGLKEETAARAAAEGNILTEYSDYMKIYRESAIGIISGRNVTMQLAHPYIASGIAQHSDVGGSVSGRFWRTLGFMYSMGFDDADGAAKTARHIRRLHTKVNGVLSEAAGMFPEGHRYNAFHPHAKLWVHMCTLESAILAYELVVGRLSETEKDEIVRATNHHHHANFGIPKSLMPNDYSALMREFHDTVRSGIICATSDGRQIDTFLFNTPGVMTHAISANVHRMQTTMLPAKLAQKFYGRSPTSIERLLVSLQLGMYRFIYRLLPLHARWTSKFIKLRRRQGVPISTMDEAFAATARTVMNFILLHLMPERPREDFGNNAAAKKSTQKVATKDPTQNILSELVSPAIPASA